MMATPTATPLRSIEGKQAALGFAAHIAKEVRDTMHDSPAERSAPIRRPAYNPARPSDLYSDPKNWAAKRQDQLVLHMGSDEGYLRASNLQLMGRGINNQAMALAALLAQIARTEPAFPESEAVKAVVTEINDALKEVTRQHSMVRTEPLEDGFGLLLVSQEPWIPPRTPRPPGYNPRN